jgi:hypothetical protein
VAAADDQDNAETCSTAAEHSLLLRKLLSTLSPCGLRLSARRFAPCQHFS